MATAKLKTQDKDKPKRVRSWSSDSRPVRRLSDDHVFTNSVAAATHYGKSIARAIEASCNKRIKDVERSRWEWAAPEDLPKPDFGDKSILLDRIKKDLREKYFYRIYGEANLTAYRSKMKPVAYFFGLEDSVKNYAEWTRTSEVYLEYISTVNKFELSFTSEVSFARHLKVRSKFYERLVGLEVSKMSFPYYKGKFSAIRINPDLINSNLDFNSQFTTYADKRGRIQITGNPIKCSNGITYPSISRASEETLVPRRDIVFYCNKDIDIDPGIGGILTFEYGKWEDVDSSWFLGKPKRLRIPVMDEISGQKFESIQEAAINIIGS